MNTPQMASVKWMLFKNSTRGVIPSHGVFQGSGDSTVDPTTGEVLITAGLTGDNLAFFINGPCAVPDGGYGMCGVPSNCTMFARFEGDASTLNPWTTKLGPRPGEAIMKADGEKAFLYAGYKSDDGTIISVMAVPVGRPASGPLVRYEITEPDCEAGTALATITAVTCEADEPSVGDEITIKDEDGWFAGETDSTLRGRTGTAHKFNIPDGYDDCSYIIITLSPAPFSC